MANFVVKFEKTNKEGKNIGFIQEVEKNFSDVTEAMNYRNEVLDKIKELNIEEEVKKVTGHVCLLTNLDANMFGYPILPHSNMF